MSNNVVRTAYPTHHFLPAVTGKSNPIILLTISYLHLSLLGREQERL